MFGGGGGRSEASAAEKARAARATRAEQKASEADASRRLKAAVLIRRIVAREVSNRETAASLIAEAEATLALDVLQKQAGRRLHRAASAVLYAWRLDQSCVTDNIMVSLCQRILAGMTATADPLESYVALVLDKLVRTTAAPHNVFHRSRTRFLDRWLCQSHHSPSTKSHLDL